MVSNFRGRTTYLATWLSIVRNQFNEIIVLKVIADKRNLQPTNSITPVALLKKLLNYTIIMLPVFCQECIPLRAGFRVNYKKGHSCKLVAWRWEFVWAFTIRWTKDSIGTVQMIQIFPHLWMREYHTQNLATRFHQILSQWTLCNYNKCDDKFFFYFNRTCWLDENVAYNLLEIIMIKHPELGVARREITCQHHVDYSIQWGAFSVYPIPLCAKSSQLSLIHWQLKITHLFHHGNEHW